MADGYRCRMVWRSLNDGDIHKRNFYQRPGAVIVSGRGREEAKILT